MQSYGFLFWAYNLIWLGISAYLLFLFLRLRRLSRRMDQLEQQADRSRDASR